LTKKKKIAILYFDNKGRSSFLAERKEGDGGKEGRGAKISVLLREKVPFLG